MVAMKVFRKVDERVALKAVKMVVEKVSWRAAALVARTAVRWVDE